MSVVQRVPHSLNYCCFTVSAKPDAITPPIVFFFFKIVLATLDPSNFYVSFETDLSLSRETPHKTLRLCFICRSIWDGMTVKQY